VALIVVFSMLVIGVVIIAVYASQNTSNTGNKGYIEEKSAAFDYSYIDDNPSAINIHVEQVSRPEYPDENYADKATGLFSSTGITEYVLPSTALIKVFGESTLAPLGTGSGIIMSANGYIITNAHVVAGGVQYAVTLSDGSSYEAQLLGFDNLTDVAVLKISAEGLTPASFGKSTDVKTGEQVAVIASSGEELNDFVTFGYVSNADRKWLDSSNNEKSFVQIDAAINPGNSGGPVVNMYGQVIGIVTSKVIGGDSVNIYESIGFAVQIDTVLNIAGNFIEFGYGGDSVRIGITYYAIDNYTASEYGLVSGLMVESIDPDCDVASSGLKYEDIITAINGVEVLTPQSVVDALKGCSPGDIITIEYSRITVTGEIREFKTEVKLEPPFDVPSNEGYQNGVALM
jgi:serine protease Do